MGSKINVSLFLFFLAISLLFSCDKDNVNKQFGQYAVAVNYAGSNFLELQFLIDGKECGKLIPVPNVNPSYVEDCRSLKDPDNLINIFVLKKVKPGEHTLEIRTASGSVVKALKFQMLNKECIFQDVSLTFN